MIRLLGLFQYYVLELNKFVLLTFSVGLHARCGIDCVTKQTVPRHLKTNNARTYGTYNKYISHRYHIILPISFVTRTNRDYCYWSN